MILILMFVRLTVSPLLWINQYDIIINLNYINVILLTKNLKCANTSEDILQNQNFRQKVEYVVKAAISGL